MLFKNVFKKKLHDLKFNKKKLTIANIKLT